MNRYVTHQPHMNTWTRMSIACGVLKSRFTSLTSNACVTWLIHMCDMTHSYVWHDSFTCVNCLIHVWDISHSIWEMRKSHCTPFTSRACVTLLIHVCDTTHPYVWHDSFICVTWLIHTCDMTHSNVTYSKSRFICVTWLVHMCDVTHSYVWHD